MKKNEIIILGLLLEKDMYGYEIFQTVKERHMEFWIKVSMSSLYKTLENLEKRAYIEVKQEKVGKTPQRNIYSVTDKGKKRLNANLKEIINKVFYHEHPMELTISFIYGIENEEAVKLLEKRLKQVEENIYHINEILEFYRGKIPVNWLYMIDSNVMEAIIERRLIRKMIRSYEDGSFQESLDKAALNHDSDVLEHFKN